MEDPAVDPTSGAPAPPPPAAPQSPGTPAPGSIPMFDPADPAGSPPKFVPPEDADTARQAGGEEAFHLIDPADQKAKWVPHSDLQTAVSAGGTPVGMKEARRVQAAMPKVNASASLGTGTLDARRALASATGVNAFDAPIGFVRGAAKTYTGALDLGRKIGNDTSTKGPVDQAIENYAKEPDATMGEKGGDLLEGVLEFVRGQKVLENGGAIVKAVSQGEKLQEALPLLKLAEKYPKLAEFFSSTGAKVAGNAVEQGAVTGAQSYVRSGGDAGQAATDAAVGTGVAGAIGGTGALITAGVKKVMASRAAADLEGVKASGLQSKLNEWKQQVAAAKQGYNEAVSDWRRAGSEATQAHADALDVWRQKIQEAKDGHDQALDAWKSQKRAAIQAHSDNVAAWQSQVDQANQAHADALDQWQQAGDQANQAHADAVQQWGDQVDQARQGHQQALDDWKQQLAEFENEQKAQAQATQQGNQALGRQTIKDTVKGAVGDAAARLAPSSPGLDVDQVIRNSDGFSDAAENLRQGARDSYERFNEATDGKFQQLRAQRTAALKNMASAGGPEALAKANQGIADLFASTKGKVSMDDFNAVTNSWRDAADLDKFGQLEKSFEPVTEDAAARRGVARGFDGNDMARRLKNVIDGMGRPRAEELIGKDRLATLEDVIDLNRTPANRAKFGDAVQRVADELVKAEPPPKPVAPELPSKPVKPDAIAKPVKPELPAKPTKPTLPGKPESPALPKKPTKPAALPRPEKPELPPRPDVPETDAAGVKIPEYLKSKFSLRLGAMAAGGMLGEAAGGHYLSGIAAAEAAYEASKYVMRQIYANPKIGQNIVFWIKSGARPEVAAPFVAQMIRNDQQGASQ